jgi:hypothetical protein
MKNTDNVAMNDAKAMGATAMSSENKTMEQIAEETVKQAVARWTTGLSAQEAAAPATQVRWYEEAHANFMAWVDAGGFSQMEADSANGSVAPAKQSSPAEEAVQPNQRAPVVCPAPAAPGVTCSA